MPKTQDYKKLKHLWYKKLKASGFVDIEYEHNATRQNAADFRRKGFRDTIESKREFYELANVFLHVHKFESNLNKTIWEYYSNGISIRNIAKLLKTARIKRMKKSHVGQIVKHYKELMKQKLVK